MEQNQYKFDNGNGGQNEYNPVYFSDKHNRQMVDAYNIYGEELFKNTDLIRAVLKSGK
jgi:hypothetical protein